MILITGANGHLGSQVIDFLFETLPKEKITGLVRSEEKGTDLKAKGVEIRIGDYADTSSVQQAVKGVDILLLISSSTMDNRPGQHKNVIEAAKEHGVKHLFYTSMLQADKLLSPLTRDHYDTEKILKTSGIPYTINRHTFYTEFFPIYLGDALETGEWYFPSGGEKVNLAFRTEMAEALAYELAEADKHQNKVYEITSSNAYTLKEYAQMLSEAADKKITYKDLPVKDFEEHLKKAGLSDEAIAMSLMTAESFVKGALAHTDNDLEKLLGRKPKSPKEFIHNFVNSTS